jgi:hypothetical protein
MEVTGQGRVTKRKREKLVPVQFSRVARLDIADLQIDILYR